VLETRRIASLRIHVEKVIRRLREFNILKLHSTIHHELLHIVDDIIIVVGGLINIQLPLYYVLRTPRFPPFKDD